MRMSLLATLPLLGALAVAPHRASAQVSVNLHLGRPVVVTDYAAGTYGDWHTSYRHWAPTTLYLYNGNWYHHAVRGGRAVTVYSSNGHYFMPPRDNAWKDRRYNVKRRPIDDDYTHVAPAPPPYSRPRP